MFIAKFFTYAPAVGLVGLALYHALSQHDVTAAGQDLANAAAIFGIGAAVHSTNEAINPK